MILFNATSDPIISQTLEIVLGAAPAAQLAWVSTYADLQADDIDYVTLTGVTNSTTAVTIVESPPEDSDTFQLKTFNIKNQNSAAVTVIIQYNDTAIIRELLRVTLAQHESLIYGDTESWYVLDSFGAVKIVISGSSPTGRLVQVNPSAATLTDGYTVPAGKRFKGHVNVANRSTATTFRVSLAPDGAADNVVQYLAYDITISDNNIYDSSEFNIDALDVVRVRATLATLTFTITGEEFNA